MAPCAQIISACAALKAQDSKDLGLPRVGVFSALFILCSELTDAQESATLAQHTCPTIGKAWGDILAQEPRLPG